MDVKKAVFGNVSNKSIKLIIIVFGFLSIFLAYFVGYTKFTDMTKSIESTNKKLRVEEATLKKMHKNIENNQTLVDVYGLKGDNILDKYPSVLHSEDTVAYAINMEKKADSSLLIDNIAIGDLEVIYITDEDGAMNEENAEMSVQDQAEANGGVMTVTANTVDARLTADEKADIKNYGITHDYSYALCKTPATYSFTVGYEDLKTVLKTIRTNQDKQSIDSVSLSYDKETGNLNGTIVVNQYTIAGTDKGYKEPSFEKNSIGNDSPFSTLE